MIAAAVLFAPEGVGDILQCEITHNTLTSGGFKDEGLINPVDSASFCVSLFSFHNVLSNFVVSVSSGPRRLN